MDHLYRDLAPITDATWDTLDDEARTRLQPALGARRLVDFVGPLGWQHSATALGRVGTSFSTAFAGVTGRSRQVLPLAELRADFALSRSELDDDARGAVDTDLTPLDEAAVALASAENAAIFHGWDAAGFVGIVPSSPHAPLTGAGEPGRLAPLVAEAIATLSGAGVGGPYGLAVDTATWTEISGGSDAGGAVLQRHLERILGGPVAWTPGITGAVVVSLRGGDFILESGQDISLGYTAHSRDAVELYLIESLSFRVATPEAAIAIR